jgi:hypothetical protein
MQHQSTIGWEQVRRGHLSLQWVHCVDELYQNTSGEQYCITLLKTIWSEVYSIWVHRCDHVHGQQVSILREQLLNEYRPRVQKLFDESDALLHIDRHLFRRSPDIILQLNNTRLVNWVLKAERHFKVSLLRAKREASKHKSSLRRHFPLFDKNNEAEQTQVKPKHQRRPKPPPPVPSRTIDSFFTPVSTTATNPYAVRRIPPTETPSRIANSRTSSTGSGSTTYITSFFPPKPRDAYPHHNTEKPP